MLALASRRVDRKFTQARTWSNGLGDGRPEGLNDGCICSVAYRTAWRCICMYVCTVCTGTATRHVGTYRYVRTYVCSI